MSAIGSEDRQAAARTTLGCFTGVPHQRITALATIHSLPEVAEYARDSDYGDVMKQIDSGGQNGNRRLGGCIQTQDDRDDASGLRSIDSA